MKLGAYGCLRVAMMLFPRGLDPWGFHVLGFGSWQEVFAALAVIGIVYGASIALVQKDLKFVVGYSSVSHMGFVLLGLMTLNQIGLSGAVYQMFSHGIIAGLLFAVVGRMVYDRTHTRDLGELSRIPLGPVDSLCGGDVCAGVYGLDWAAGIQRVYRRVGGADRKLARISLDGLDRRVGNSDRHCIFVARAASHLFWRAGNHARTGAAADHAAGASGSVPVAGEHDCAGSLSQGSDGFDSAQPERATLRAASRRGDWR